MFCFPIQELPRDNAVDDRQLNCREFRLAFDNETAEFLIEKMKFRLLLSIVIVTSWFSFQASAQDLLPDDEQAPDPPIQIRVQVEFIETSHKQLTDLMSVPNSAVSDTNLRAKVAKLIADGKADVLDTMCCTAKNSNKSVTESISEFIYPTEYLPAGSAGGSPSKDEKASKPTQPVPTAFETRNLGSTMEIEPFLQSDKKHIELRLIPEIVYHVGETVWAEHKDAQGDKSIKMPRIFTMRLNTEIYLACGHPMLAGVLSPKNDKGFPDFKRKVMVFVKADVVTPGS